MNKKLYAQLLLTIIVGNYAVADEGSFFNTIGRSYNGNSTIGNSYNGMVSAAKPSEKISFSDAKDLKGQMKDISKNISTLSADKKSEIKIKVTNLADLVKKNQVANKGNVKKFKKQ